MKRRRLLIAEGKAGGLSMGAMQSVSIGFAHPELLFKTSKEDRRK